MAVEGAPGSGVEGERKVRTGAALVENRREDPGFHAAGDARCISRIDQAGCHQILHDRVLLGVIDADAMSNTRGRIVDCVQCRSPNILILDPTGIFDQRLFRRLDEL